MSASSPDPLLAVIPVRGGSKRIPRKWSQLVNGRPLLQHAIDTARAAEGIDRLVVCTEDPAVAAYARLRGVDVIDRPAHLAADDVPIQDVARFVADETDWEGDLAVIQATCPLLKPNTLSACIAEWKRLRFDWMITVSKSDRIYWQDGRPLTPRLQSQDLTDSPRCLYRESGAVQIGTGDYWRDGLAPIRGMIPIPAEEALDIDTHADLAAARQALGRRTIGFHVVATDEKGSGHLRRCLQLSDALSHHDVWWDQSGLEGWAIAEAERHGIRWAGPRSNVTTFGDREEVWIGNPDPDLVVVDALEDATRLAPWYAAQGIPTVLFEYDGPMLKFADLAIDEFSEPSLTILRPEFLCLPPFTVKEKADGVLVTFGGTDPAGMNSRVERIVRHGTDSSILVMGPGSTSPYSMAEAMRMADLVITSQGRTVHEAAAVGVPCLSIAVNERETRHARLPGVVYLGLAHTLSDAAILDAVNRLLLSPALRAEMSATSSGAIDGRGVERVVFEIERLLRGLA